MADLGAIAAAGATGAATEAATEAAAGAAAGAATGAAIALDDDSSLNLVNSHFDANAADNNGAASSSNGIYWQNAQTLCTNCIREPSWSNSQANAEQPLLHEAAGGR